MMRNGCENERDQNWTLFVGAKLSGNVHIVKANAATRPSAKPMDGPTTRDIFDYGTRGTNKRLRKNKAASLRNQGAARGRRKVDPRSMTLLDRAGRRVVGTAPINSYLENTRKSPSHIGDFSRHCAGSLILSAAFDLECAVEGG